MAVDVEMADPSAAPLSLKQGKEVDRAFSLIALLIQVLLGIAFCFTDYNLFAHSVFESIELAEICKGMSVLALAGFGFLYSFLKGYGMGGVSFSFFIIALGFQWALLVQETMETGTVKNMVFDFTRFLGADFAVVTALIGFGALLGKTSPTQVLVFTLLSVAAYSANKIYFLNGYMEVYDVGGTISTHVFGAVFGLVTSVLMGPANNEVLLEGSRNSEAIAMIGSIFLGLFWPTLVSASVAVGSQAQWTAVTNTIVAVTGSTVSSFGWVAAFDPDRKEKSSWFCKGGRLSPHVVSVCRLAGGVAIGAIASVPIGPGPAMLIGNCAGFLSAWGFQQDLVPMRYDTVGITYLNLMPGILGTVASAVAPLCVRGSGILPDSQIFGLLGTVIFAAASGAITGLLLRGLGTPRVAYNDYAYFETSHNEHVEPQSFFDRMKAAVADPLHSSRPSSEIGH